MPAVSFCEENPAESYVNSPPLAQCNTQVSPGDTPALLAAENGHALTLTALLRPAKPSAAAAAPEMEQRDRDGRTPLARAAGRGRAGCVAALLALGANPGAPTKARTQELPNPRLLHLLLTLADGRHTTTHSSALFPQTGEAPAHLAAAGGHVECLQLLLDGGADPDARDSVRLCRRSPLLAAPPRACAASLEAPLHWT